MKKMMLLFIGAFLMLSISTASAQGFTGYYDPANWLIQLPAPQHGGSIGLFDANTLVINGPDGADCFNIGGAEVSASIVIPQSGTVSFDWDYFSTDDPGWDFFITLQSYNGNDDVLVQVTNTSNGSFSETLNAGDKLSLIVYSVDCLLGEGIATITNFSAPDAPPAVPISNWALYLGILLMLTFVVIRFKRMM